MKNFPHSWLGPILTPHVGSPPGPPSLTREVPFYRQSGLSFPHEFCRNLWGPDILVGCTQPLSPWNFLHSAPTLYLPFSQLSLHRKMPGCSLCPLGGSHYSGKRCRSHSAATGSELRWGVGALPWAPSSTPKGRPHGLWRGSGLGFIWKEFGMVLLVIISFPAHWGALGQGSGSGH